VQQSFVQMGEKIDNVELLLNLSVNTRKEIENNVTAAIAEEQVLRQEIRSSKCRIF